jgi:hypothetical protein
MAWREEMRRKALLRKDVDVGIALVKTNTGWNAMNWMSFVKIYRQSTRT